MGETGMGGNRAVLPAGVRAMCLTAAVAVVATEVCVDNQRLPEVVGVLVS